MGLGGFTDYEFCGGKVNMSEKHVIAEILIAQR